jgi:DNA-binding transcriptional regulator YiaG
MAQTTKIKKTRSADHVAIGLRLKRLRESEGFRRDCFSHLIGVCLSRLSLLEHGRGAMTGDNLKTLALAGYDVNLLLTGCCVEQIRAGLSRNAG